MWVAQNVERKLRNFLGHILGEGLLRFDRGAGRADDPRLYQKSGDGGQAVGSDAIEARVLMKSHLPYQNS
jgi:hypothetical protein